MKHQLKQIHLILCLLIVLITNAYASKHTFTTKSYIGASRAELINCLGQPSRQLGSHEKNYLLYMSESQCQVAFVLKDNKVEKIFYTGKHGKKLDPSQCPIVMRDCTSKKTSG